MAFSLRRKDVRGRVLIPKFYDPDLREAEKLASKHYELKRLGDLLLPGPEGSRLGSWIRREHYGSGDIPYVRTSDLVNWRIRPDYKKAVSEEVYESVRATQDVRVNDILFVAHGTYLVGNVAIVTEAETKLVLQDHVFRLRIDPTSGLSPLVLLAALSTAFVRRQVRARQFSADIIDKIGERHLDIVVPIPAEKAQCAAVARVVANVIKEQNAARQEVSDIAAVQSRMTKERAESNLGFQVSRRSLRSRILVPKYYDPRISEALARVQVDSGETWLQLSHYIEQGVLSADTGAEVGKMAYGTGSVPFIRTSDIVDLELRRDTRHCVSEEIYESYKDKAGVLPGDVLIVRDGTYLVGSSAQVSPEDGVALVCGGIYRLRVSDDSKLLPQTLLLALNLPLVRQQLRARQFTRDVIDTLGKRLLEVKVPPLTSKHWRELGERLGGAMQRKARAKTAIGQSIELVEPPAPKVISGRPSWSMR
ncbi:hypothetical protein NG829_03260 [Xanthomonas sacchari]|uniref:hypothetical protein n=1 Tax=Xanthomonas sacchari TaxID=56458 RepID=UPI00225E606B|nr:hypothetical protein [Xanthomonas sacchari]UYK81346.1 hypothetical protein NG829_03260 [Xanthomonas sacchari]